MQAPGPQDGGPPARFDLAEIRRALDAQAEAQWRLPVGIWILPASLLGCCMLGWLGLAVLRRP